MKTSNKKQIVHQQQIQDIVESLKLNGVTCTYVPHTSYTLSHSLNRDQFDALIKAIVTHHNLKPQNSEWFPGTCTGDDADFGYYVCPMIHDQYEEGDFDMCITYDALYYC